MATEMRRDFHDQLASLEDALLAMGQHVLDMCTEVMQALVDKDADRARAVIRADDRLDAESREIEQGIFTVIALQAPVARELRTLAAFMHTNMHLERMGDQCVNIGKFVASYEETEGDPELFTQLADMGTHARRVAAQALEALRNRDVALANTLGELDDPVDRINRGLFRRLAQLASAGEHEVDWAMRLVLVARYLERLADHAVDIGEQVVFIETGQRVELSSNSPT